MSELVQGITDANFNENIQSGVVLVDFWAEWCGPCNMLTPIIEEVAQELKDKVKIYKMNLDHNPNTPSSLGVRSIPTLILFKDGKQVSNQVGLLSKVQLKNWIESSI